MTSPLQSIKFFCRVPETRSWKGHGFIQMVTKELEFKLGVGPCGLFVYDLATLSYNPDQLVIIQKADNRHLRGTTLDQQSAVPLIAETKEFIYKMVDVTGRITKVLG